MTTFKPGALDMDWQFLGGDQLFKGLDVATDQLRKG
jgi:hypothetical protein